MATYDLKDSMFSETPPQILCPMCGIGIPSSSTGGINMCMDCLKTRVDITDGICKQIPLMWCRNCGRYQRPPYVAVELESKEMLALCLKKIKGLNKDIKLVDASFVWTEPHSRRIKVKCTVQKEVHHAILQQSFVVEFVITNQQCTDCQKSFTEHTWKANVQVRQKVKHKGTMYFLEQMLIKHHVCDRVLQVKEMPGGLDFFWSSKSHANAFLSFLQSVVPVRCKASKRLISQDDNNSSYNYKFTMYAEIAPICKDDLVIVEPKLMSQLGGSSPLMVVQRVASVITMLDPITMKIVEISGGTYWHHPFPAIMNSKQLVEYIVIEIERIQQHGNENAPDITDLRSFNRQNNSLNHKICLAHATVARSSDFGINDQTFEVTTHLGNWLKTGDMVLGYDLTNANLSDIDPKLLRGKSLPDVMLVRKSFADRKNRASKRRFEIRQLKKIEEDNKRKGDQERDANDMEDFMQDIEEDPEMRAKINLYKRSDLGTMNNDDVGTALDGEEDGVDDNDLPQIGVDELLDDLSHAHLSENTSMLQQQFDEVDMDGEDDDSIPLATEDDNVDGMSDHENKSSKKPSKMSSRPTGGKKKKTKR